MSKKTAILFVSGGPQSDIREFERNIKSQYLTGDPSNYPCLSFLHESSERDILEKVRGKRPGFLIFDHVNENRIKTIRKVILKKANGTSPEMMHTGINQEVDDVPHMIDHQTIALKLL